MTWAEFRRWAWNTYGYRIKGGSTVLDPAWRPIIGLGKAHYSGQHANAATRTGSGKSFYYDEGHQLRFAFWLRAKGLLANKVLYDWLDAAERYNYGWLVNDGSGLRWLAQPQRQAQRLVGRGFVAVKCGL